jgi:hypothetical protein
MVIKKKAVVKKKVEAPKKKLVARKVVSVKPLEKTISKPKASNPAESKRIQTAAGWKRMMLKSRALKVKK